MPAFDAALSPNEIVRTLSPASMFFMSNLVSWDHQRAFLAVMEEGNLSGAARRLGVSQPTARGWITALEESLGAKLFSRSVNGLTPTAL